MLGQAELLYYSWNGEHAQFIIADCDQLKERKRFCLHFEKSFIFGLGVNSLGEYSQTRHIFCACGLTNFNVDFSLRVWFCPGTRFSLSLVFFSLRYCLHTCKLS